MIRILIEDLDLYLYRKGWPKFLWPLVPFMYVTTWPVIVYRLHHHTYYHVKVPLLRRLLLILCNLMKFGALIVTNVTISEKAKIGKGLFIAHCGSIVISHHTRIGDFVSIHQGVTVGGAGRGDKFGAPEIGNCVYIGAGAKIIGKIKVSKDVMIGANAVVNRDVSEHVTVAGVPARIINHDGSEGWIHYRRR